MPLPTTPEVPFQRVTIQVVNRPFVVPSATPPVYPLRIGHSFDQYMAPDDAMGWFAQAAAMLTDSEIARVNGLSPRGQFDHVDAVMTAIERGANNLNIFIWSDPVSRACYRKWLSGPPASFANIFDPRLNWGGDRTGGSGFGSGFEVGWYVPNSNLPVIDDSDTTGLIPKAARAKFRAAISTVTNPNQFVPTIGFDLSTVHGEAPSGGSNEITRELLVALQPNVINRHWIIQGSLGSDTCVAGFAYPRVCQYVPGQIVGVGGFKDNARVQGDDWNRWDTFFAQAPAIGYSGTLICAEGPYRYLPFLRELVAGFLSRTPAEIVQDTRAFITYQNAEGVIANGGPAAFLAASTGASGDVLTQMVQTNAGAQGASTAAIAVGTALVAAGGYAAVAGLIVMAAGYFAQIADRLIAKDVTGHGKDDLGRFKPVLERFALSGDATLPDTDPSAHPGFPAYQAPAGTVSRSTSGFFIPFIPTFPTLQQTRSNTSTDVLREKAKEKANNEFWGRLGVSVVLAWSAWKILFSGGSQAVGRSTTAEPKVAR